MMKFAYLRDDCHEEQCVYESMEDAIADVMSEYSNVEQPQLHKLTAGFYALVSGNVVVTLRRVRFYGGKHG